MIETAITQGALRAAMDSLACAELSWRLDTPAAREARRRRTLAMLKRRHSRRLRAEMLAASSDRDRAIVAQYNTLHGVARKRFRARHGQALKRAGAVASVGGWGCADNPLGAEP